MKKIVCLITLLAVIISFSVAYAGLPWGIYRCEICGEEFQSDYISTDPPKKDWFDGHTHRWRKIRDLF